MRILKLFVVLFMLVGCAAPPKTAVPTVAQTTTPAVVRATSSSNLAIIKVEDWGGTRMSMSDSQRQRATTKAHTPRKITLHHGGVAFLRDKDPQQYLRNLQTWSRNTRGWVDIPYHYLIDLDGRVYEGRDVMIAGDTNTEYDPAGHALIVVLGNFDEVEPNQAQLASVTATMVMLAKRFSIPETAIAGHKDFAASTACPGKSLYPYLQSGYFQREVARQLAD
jgi:N-acetylmuramoyl-L-alanine amidase